MKTAAATCFVEKRMAIFQARIMRSRTSLRAQRPVYICNSTNTDSGNSNTRAAAMAAAFVVTQALLLAGPSTAAVKTNLRGVAPDLRNPAVREERFRQQLMETEAEMGYPRANTFLRSKDLTDSFLTMQVKKGVATAPSTGPAALMQGAGKAMPGKRG